MMKSQNSRSRIPIISVVFFSIALALGSASAQPPMPPLPIDAPLLPETPPEAFLANVRQPSFIGNVLSAVQWYLIPSTLETATPLYVYDFQTACENLTQPGPSDLAAIIGPTDILLGIETIDRDQLPSEWQTEAQLPHLAVDTRTGTLWGALVYQDVATALTKAGVSCIHSSQSPPSCTFTALSVDIPCDHYSINSSQENQPNWFIATTRPFPAINPERRYVGQRHPIQLDAVQGGQ